MDLFDKFVSVDEPLLHISRATHGIATYPKLDGPVGAHMRWQDREQIVWSINNYLGIANLPEVREADVEFARLYGFARPMGSRMMCGETDILEQLEEELANYVKKPAALFLNYGYQGMASLIDSLTTSSDWIVLDSQCHACIIDGVRLKKKGGLDQTRTFSHNNIDELQACLAEIDRVRSADAGVLVITEGVFGMSGDQGALREIVELKKTYDFRLLVDDAHGFGALGATGQRSRGRTGRPRWYRPIFQHLRQSGRRHWGIRRIRGQRNLETALHNALADLQQRPTPADHRRKPVPLRVAAHPPRSAPASSCHRT